jgi:hypothetical protein
LHQLAWGAQRIAGRLEKITHGRAL